MLTGSPGAGGRSTATESIDDTNSNVSSASSSASRRTSRPRSRVAVPGIEHSGPRPQSYYIHVAAAVTLRTVPLLARAAMYETS